MVKKKICDKCRTERDITDKTFYEVKILNVEPAQTITYDVCGECKMELTKFMQRNPTSG